MSHGNDIIKEVLKEFDFIKSFDRSLIISFLESRTQLAPQSSTIILNKDNITNEKAPKEITQLKNGLLQLSQFLQIINNSQQQKIFHDENIQNTLFIQSPASTQTQPDSLKMKKNNISNTNSQIDKNFNQMNRQNCEINDSFFKEIQQNQIDLEQKRGCISDNNKKSYKIAETEKQQNSHSFGDSKKKVSCEQENKIIVIEDNSDKMQQNLFQIDKQINKTQKEMRKDLTYQYKCSQLSQLINFIDLEKQDKQLQQQQHQEQSQFACIKLEDELKVETSAYIGWYEMEYQNNGIKSRQTVYFYRIYNDDINQWDQFFRLSINNEFAQEFIYLIFIQFINVLKQYNISRYNLNSSKGQQIIVLKKLLEDNPPQSARNQIKLLEYKKIINQIQKQNDITCQRFNQLEYDELIQIYYSSLDEISAKYQPSKQITLQKSNSFSNNQQNQMPQQVELHTEQLSPQRQYEVSSLKEYLECIVLKKQIPSHNPFYYYQSNPCSSFVRNNNQFNQDQPSPQSDFSSNNTSPNNLCQKSQRYRSNYFDNSQNQYLNERDKSNDRERNRSKLISKEKPIKKKNYQIK